MEEDPTESAIPSPAPSMELVIVEEEEPDVAAMIPVSSREQQQGASKDDLEKDAVPPLKYIALTSYLSKNPKLADSVSRAVLQKPETKDRSTQTPKTIRAPRRQQKNAAKSSKPKKPAEPKAQGKRKPETKKETGSGEKPVTWIISVISTNPTVPIPTTRTLTSTGTITPIEQILQNQSSSRLRSLPPLCRIGTNELISTEGRVERRRPLQTQASGNAGSGLVRYVPIAPRPSRNLVPPNMPRPHFDQFRQAKPPVNYSRARTENRIAPSTSSVGAQQLSRIKPAPNRGRFSKQVVVKNDGNSKNFQVRILSCSDDENIQLAVAKKPTSTDTECVQTYPRLLAIPSTSRGQENQAKAASPSCSITDVNDENIPPGESSFGTDDAPNNTNDDPNNTNGAPNNTKGGKD